VLERALGTVPVPRTQAPAAPADPIDALVDEGRMRVFRDDYPEIVEQLVNLFVDGTPPLLDELRAGAERGDREAVRSAAHKLKGSCQNIGAGFMATLAHDLERHGKAEARELAGLERAFEHTRDALRAALTPGST
jgi:HPt (histidine-containing phosphotransfer) domain-containing protein